MKVEVKEWCTDIYLNNDEVKELCKPGAGDDTCIYLLCGGGGFQCARMHGSLILIDLLEGNGSAKREGCQFIKNINPMKLGLGTYDIEYK